MSARKVVPCAGCTACCRGEPIPLLPDKDDVASYVSVPYTPPNLGLGWPANVSRAIPQVLGNCFYLGPNGCSIWQRAPAVCRNFDCRLLVKQMHDSPFAKSLRAQPEVIAAGRARLATLGES